MAQGPPLLPTDRRVLRTLTETCSGRRRRSPEGGNAGLELDRSKELSDAFCAARDGALVEEIRLASDSRGHALVDLLNEEREIGATQRVCTERNGITARASNLRSPPMPLCAPRWPRAPTWLTEASTLSTRGGPRDIYCSTSSSLLHAVGTCRLSRGGLLAAPTRPTSTWPRRGLRNPMARNHRPSACSVSALDRAGGFGISRSPM